MKLSNSPIALQRLSNGAEFQDSNLSNNPIGLESWIGIGVDWRFRTSEVAV